MTQYFLSYTRADEKFALRLTDDLRASGVDLWVDQRDIKLSTPWDRAIEAALRSCAAVVVVLSPRAVGSENVLNEVGFALDHGKDVIPVLLEACEIPIRISRLQRVDFTGDYDVALERCRTTLGGIDPELVRRAEGELTAYLGPLASKFVKVDAAKAHDAAELYRVLGAHILDAEKQAAFLKNAPIRVKVRKRRRPALIPKIAAVALATVLIALFVHSMIQIAQLRNARSEADALAAYDRLRAGERLFVPRLWLVGRWKPQVLIAQALNKRAAKMLASPLRKQMDDGLLLSAQAAMLSGAKLTDAAQRVYDEQHYESLVTSIEAGEEIAGRSLAVSSNAAEWRIAIGGQIWSCAEPIGQRPCVVFPSSSQLRVVDAAGFDSNTLRLVGYSGEAKTLDLLSGQESSYVVTDATFVAVDQGDVATSFDHGTTGGPSVRVDPAGPSLGPTNSGDFGRVKMLAFGPCRDCIATRGIDGVVKIWHWLSRGAAGNPLILPGEALSLAATRSGHRLALISKAADHITFYGADAKPEGIGPPIDLSDAESMAISPDGRHVAVVHGGNVKIFDDRAALRTLIAATKQPTPIAVAFAGNDYLVTRTPNDARVWRLRSTERRDLGPEERWAEWRKKFGLAGAGVVPSKN
ncbi:MAG TPA: toll/interleukin-1 receptor domain-containing protein [Thermoanaerobaculia bacterium]|nr:toll/interleukin-1 receptor domain-containing protein [Thermoanaerobaculia bacterium]